MSQVSDLAEQVMINIFCKIKLLFIGCLIVFNISAHEYLSAEERIVLEKRGLSGDAISSTQLAQYYTFVEYNHEKKQFWNDISIQNGSLYAMHVYASGETFILRDNKEKAKRYLQLLSSIGVLISKVFLIDLCEKSNDCSYSKFYSLVDLSIRDPSEYNMRLFCYSFENIKVLTKEELTLILAIYQNISSKNSINFLCKEEINSETALKYIKENHNTKLLVNISKWLEYIRQNPFANTDEQEDYLSNL
ncbi:MAG TPA: hypothetical protein PK055_05540 [Gammaproteobacteria bacterium]|nr:hypothetical protein [Xanthomonadales bacterium]MCB1595014.1 hypothetical protein [Xanthomonadales bacterium]HPQ87098.1 hypothetical protein [Gammaproteobacteria bacterium]